MWIFLKDAFLSIAHEEEHPNDLMVRARFRADIKRVFPDAKIEATPNRDYPFRAYIARELVGDTLCCLAEEIDYAKFKPMVPADEPERHAAYMDVWGIMYNWQTRITRRPGIFGWDWPVHSPSATQHHQGGFDIPPAYDAIPKTTKPACHNKANRRSRRQP
jgi:hypothetical protein